MKPNHLLDNQLREDTGKEVAKMVREYGLEKKVLLTSFDPVKTMAAKGENPSLVVGSYLNQVGLIFLGFAWFP